MTRRFSRLAPSLAVSLPLLLVTSCDSQPTEANGDTIPAGQAQVLLAANVSATTISTLVGEVTAPDITTPLIFNIEESGGGNGSTGGSPTPAQVFHP